MKQGKIPVTKKKQGKIFRIFLRRPKLNNFDSFCTTLTVVFLESCAREEKGEKEYYLNILDYNYIKYNSIPSNHNDCYNFFHLFHLRCIVLSR